MATGGICRVMLCHLPTIMPDYLRCRQQPALLCCSDTGCVYLSHLHLYNPPFVVYSTLCVSALWKACLPSLLSFLFLTVLRQRVRLQGLAQGRRERTHLAERRSILRPSSYYSFLFTCLSCQPTKLVPTHKLALLFLHWSQQFSISWTQTYLKYIFPRSTTNICNQKLQEMRLWTVLYFIKQKQPKIKYNSTAPSAGLSIHYHKENRYR